MPSFYLQGIFSATQVMMNLFKQMEPCRVSPYHSLLGISDVCSNLVHFSEPLSYFIPISYSVIVLNSYPEQEMKFLAANTVSSLVSVSVPEFWISWNNYYSSTKKITEFLMHKLCCHYNFVFSKKLFPCNAQLSRMVPSCPVSACFSEYIL